MSRKRVNHKLLTAQVKAVTITERQKPLLRRGRYEAFRRDPRQRTKHAPPYDIRILPRGKLHILRGKKDLLKFSDSTCMIEMSVGQNYGQGQICQRGHIIPQSGHTAARVDQRGTLRTTDEVNIHAAGNRDPCDRV